MASPWRLPDKNIQLIGQNVSQVNPILSEASSYNTHIHRWKTELTYTKYFFERENGWFELKEFIN